MAFNVRIFTPDYLLTGEAPEAEVLLGWLNNPNRQTIELSEARITALNPQATLPALTKPLVTVPKRQALGLDLVDPPAQAAVQLPPRTELAVIYTGRFIIQAQLHPPGNMPLSHIFNVVGGDFFGVTQAHLHPLVPTRPFQPVQAALLILNKAHVDLYHPR